MRLVLVLLLVLVATASLGADSAPTPTARGPVRERMTVQLDCRDLSNYLLTFIGIRSKLRIPYSDETCLTSSLMKMFLRETSALIAVQAAPPRHINLTVTDADPDLAQILALALVGRHYTSRFRAEQVFFEYDPASQIMTPHMPRCEYQRSFLVLLLFVSIVLLVFALVSQSLNAMELKSAAEKLPPPASAPFTPGYSGSSKTALQHLSIDFSHQRRAASGYTQI